MLFSNTRIKIVFLWMIFFYLFLFPVISQASYEFDNITNKKRVDKSYIEKNLKSSGYWNLDFKIHIDNNWSETKTNYDWCSGSGTWSDPYVIEKGLMKVILKRILKVQGTGILNLKYISIIIGQKQ